MNIAETKWRVTLTPDGFPAFPTFSFKVVTHDEASNVITGGIILTDTGPVKIEFARGTFRQPTANVPFLMSFELNVFGLPVFLALVVTGSSGSFVINGTYVKVRSSGAGGALLAEPGETGTGGGSQTGVG